MKEMNLIKDFLSNKNLSKIVKEYGLKYYKYSFVIEQEWEPIVNMLIAHNYNITLITRLMYYFKKLSEVCDDLEINYYVSILQNLQQIQIKNCSKEDKWYFKNLGLL